ncbi:MAG: zinc ribbon domain-containing protein [Arenicellales bacterium]
MYKTCPKCGHARDPASKKNATQCSNCGLIYNKWFNSRFHIIDHYDKPDVDLSRLLSRDRLNDLFLHVSPEINTSVFYARCIFFLFLLVWGWQFIMMDYYYYIDSHRIDTAAPEIYESILHNVNLLFHEAGHVLFRPFGRFMTILGGSLLQIIIPLTVLLVFLLKERNTFGASFGLWWTGQNFMDLAPYINDARTGQIPLLGGGTGADRPGMHDWSTILSDLGMLNSDHTVAKLVDNFGVLLMLLSFVWGALVLHRQYRQLKARQN